MTNDLLIKAINTVGREEINGIIENIKKKAAMQITGGSSSPRGNTMRKQKIASILHKPDDTGFSPLHYAVKAHRVDFVHALLECGADVDIQDKEDGWTPLMWAITIGDIDIIKALLKKNADIWIPDNQGGTILHQAVLYGHIEVIKFLLSHEIKLLDQGDSFGMTPLMWACDERNLEVIKLLLEYKPNIDVSDNNGRRAIDLCESLDLKQIIEFHAYKQMDNGKGNKKPFEESKSYHKKILSHDNKQGLAQQHNRSQTSIEFDIKHHQKILGLPMDDEDENIKVEDTYITNQTDGNNGKSQTNTSVPWSRLYLVIGTSITISSIMSSVLVAYLFQNKLLDKGALRNSIRNFLSSVKSAILKK